MDIDEEQAAPDNVRAMLDLVTQVQKTQRACADGAEQSLGKLEQDLHSLKADLQQCQNDKRATAVMSKAAGRIGKDVAKHLLEQTAPLHKLINALKVLYDATVPQDIYRDFSPEVDLDDEVLNQVIAEHFYQTGNLDIAARFAEEAGVDLPEGFSENFRVMHSVLHEIDRHNLGPALEWASAHSDELIQVSGREAVAAFHFQLHQAQYLQLFTQKGPPAALEYGKAHFPQFSATQLPHISRLMGLLLFAKRPEAGVYADLRCGPDWNSVRLAFSRQACSLMNLAIDSPLLVTVAAGAVALPTYLKHAALPVATRLANPEVELGREFTFRSFFVCPVSREQATRDNPPMILPCGHVLAKQSVLSLSKGPSSRPWKCPTCPLEAREGDCMQLYFPQPKPK